MKPHYNVVGAAILKDGKLLALRRSDGNESVIHKFEFVGGKVEEGETEEEALVRECREEISLEISVLEKLNTIEYEYTDCIVSLSVYFVKPLSDYKLKVHEEDRWLDCSEIDAFDWAPADREFLSTIKNGYLKLVGAENERDFEIIRSIAQTVMHETYDGSLPQGQIDYMIKKFLSEEAIQSSLEEREYEYKIIYLNGEIAGFAAYCPAKYYSENYADGTFLSKIYVKQFARGKRIFSKFLHTLRRPVYLTVKKDNLQTINTCKHKGFKIVESVVTDIGEGYVTDDFVMMLSD